MSGDAARARSKANTPAIVEPEIDDATF